MGDNNPDKPPNMGRLHSKGKGIASSAIPYSRSVPTWFKSSPDQVVDNICKLARKGATPSQIGVILRDSHGVAQVKVVTGNKILRILKSSGLAPEIPEDLYFLIKKAVAVRKHLERNRLAPCCLKCRKRLRCDLSGMGAGEGGECVVRLGILSRVGQHGLVRREKPC